MIFNRNDVFAVCKMNKYFYKMYLYIQYILHFIEIFVTKIDI